MSSVVGTEHAVDSVRITFNPLSGRAKTPKGKGKKSLYPDLYTSGTACIRYVSREAEETIDVHYAAKSAHRDVYFGSTVRLGDVAFKIEPTDQISNQTEKDLVDGGFDKFAVKVFWLS